MQKFLRRTIYTVFTLLILLLVLLWGVAPLAAKKLLTDFFADQDAEFVAESISVNPFTATIKAENIDVTSSRGQEFKFDAFLVELDILPLFEKQVRVAQVGLDGLHLEVVQEQEGWRVAGVFIPEGEEKPEEPPEENTGAPWQVLLPSILLNNCSVNISRLNPEGSEPLQDEIVINRLLISKIVGQELDWQGAASLSTAINGATADLNTEFRFLEGDFTQWVDIQLITANLSQFQHYVPAPMNKGNVSLSLKGEVVVKYEDEVTTLTASTKRLDLDRVSLPLEQFSLESERTQAGIDTLQVVLVPDQAPQVLFEGKLDSVKTRITTDQDRQTIAAWDNLTVTPILLRMADNVPDLTIDKVEIANLLASQNSGEDKAFPALTAVNGINIEDIKVTDKMAKVDSVAISDLNLQVLLDKERNLKTLITFPTAEKESETEAEAEPASDAKPFDVIVNRISVDGKSLLEFSDEGVSPAFNRKVNINSLKVEGLHTGNPEQAMHIVFDGKTDKYSAIKTDTRLWPFQEELSVDTRTDLQEISLHPLSPYLADALGYDIETGQLDMALTMNIDKGIMDGQTQLNIRKLHVGDTEPQKKADGTEQSGGKGLSGAIPLSAAVKMLQDNNDNIELDIPISGDTNSPDFGWGSFVGLLFNNALFDATAGIVAQSFIPYAGVLTIAKIAGDQLIQVNVEPLLYPPKVTDPQEANAEFINEFKKLLTDKEDTQVKACPIASRQDIESSATAELSEQQRAELEQLAVARGEAFKDTMIADGTIKSARILLCKPKVDLEDGAQGRMEFEL